MVLAALLLSLLGVVVLYSSSPTQAIQQALYCLTGVLIYFVLRNFDYRALKNLIKPIYLVVFVMLLIVFGLGFETRGSVRWIPLGIINLQPSEIAKPVVILSLAFFWATRSVSWLNLVKSLLLVAPLFLLIFRQPDLGTALTLGFTWFVILLVANVSWIKVGLLALLGLISAPLSWTLMHDYQHQRIMTFFFPTQDPLGRGFHVIQSMIAVGSGEFLGRGLGQGTQSRLQFLPEFRTDFIFAFIAEELGFTGSLMVLALYGAMFFFLWRVLNRVDDRLGQLIVGGVMGMTFFQVVVNVGMNIGVMPVTGITLPFLSYGGSSMLEMFICLGLVASVQRFNQKRVVGKDFNLIDLNLR